MFTTVARNFFRFLAAYFCLLVAFALSFSVLFPNYQSFNVSAVSAVVKTLVMMSGEIEYENFIYENGATLYPFTGHFMILLFVVLISIILMNLLVGLAVSDIQVGGPQQQERLFWKPPPQEIWADAVGKGKKHEKGKNICG
jgi:small-conductance mechanosensitive channel